MPKNQYIKAEIQKCAMCEVPLAFGTHCPPCLILVKGATADYEAMLNEMRKDRWKRFQPRRLK